MKETRDAVRLACWRDAVPCIDLLPYPDRHLRQARRQRRRGMGLLACGAGLAVLAVWGGQHYLDRRLAAAASANAALDGAVAQATMQAAQATRLASETEAMQRRLRALERLQDLQQRPVRWLDAMARHLPADLYLTGVDQDGESITMAGMAASHGAVTELLARLAAMPELGTVQLLESRVEGETGRVAFRIGADYSGYSGYPGYPGYPGDSSLATEGRRP